MRVILVSAIVLAATGIFLVVNDYMDQVAEYRLFAALSCVPGGSCPLFAYGFFDVPTIAGVTILVIGIILLILNDLRAISKVSAK